MTEIIPNLWFDREAAEAAAFYAEVFGGEVGTVTRYPTEGLPDFQRDRAGEPLTVEFTVRGLPFIGINGGPDMPRSPGISCMISVDPRTEPEAVARIDAMWERLIDGGTILMPLDAYPFSGRYGWVQDRWGHSWQLILAQTDREAPPPIMISLLFSGDLVNRAGEAIDTFTALFPDSGEGTRVPYGEASGPATAEALMFADFTLAGRTFTAMDSGIEQDEAFTPAFSLAVTCADQAEIDRYWEVLSTRPEVEQCGWCQDAFGISWQIVPAQMGELMATPGAYERMMSMGKLSIAGLRGEE